MQGSMTRTCLAVALLWCTSACGPVPLEPRDPDPGAAHFTVQTFNVEFLHSGDEATIEAVGHANADIVCLQEVTPDWELVLRDRYGEQYPSMLFRSKGGTGGLAALSHYTMEDRGILPSPDGSHPAWHLLVDSPMGMIEVLNVHLRSAFAGQSGVKAAAAFLSIGGDHSKEIQHYYSDVTRSYPTLAVGDFNEEPGGDAVKYLESQGFQDILSLYHPGQPTWRYPPSWQLEQCLDHILFDSSFEPLNAWVEQRGNSDHLPVVAHLESAQH